MYTKGEWQAEVGYTNIYIIASKGTKHSAVADIPTSNDNAEANANLIASAPDMYEALLSALGSLVALGINDHSWGEEIRNNIQQALAKANGK